MGVVIDAYTIHIRLLAELVVTSGMTLVETSLWKRWKLTGVLEWHENQISISKFFGLDVNKPNFHGILLLHFFNGGLGGLGYLLAIELFSQLSSIPIPVFGVLYGLILWILTVAPIHQIVTGLHPLCHPLGKGPALASLGGCAVYGPVLDITFFVIAAWNIDDNAHLSCISEKSGQVTNKLLEKFPFDPAI